MTGKEFLLAVSEAVRPAREIRHQPDEVFDDLSVEELSIVERGLRALEYSVHSGAARIAKLIESRRS